MILEGLRFSDYCANCRKSLERIEKVLFVEKELGRCFCCEECIKDYFQPTVDFMSEELGKMRSDQDMSEAEAKRYGHYQPLTLEDPDEIWVDQTETGERHFTFIAHYCPGEERFSYVVVSLAIDHVPSFVFMSFATRDENLLEEYRRGVDLKADESTEEVPEVLDLAPERPQQHVPASEAAPESPEPPPDGLSEVERLYAELRQSHDIPRDQFPRYEPFIEAAIDEADEIWRLVDDQGNEWLTFIARFSGEDLGEVEDFTVVAVAEATYDESGPGFEVVFAFPTTDPGLVQHFRKGINSLNKAFGVGWTRGRAA